VTQADGQLLPGMLVAMLVLLGVALILLVSRYLSVRRQYDGQVRDNRQLQAELNDLALRQFEDWRERELESARRQLEDAAYTRARGMMEEWRQKWEASIRAQAISQSGAVITGRVTEQLAPYIGDFPYNPKDVRFIGSPIDLIVFDGLSEGAVRRIVLLEVKSGAATLSRNQRQIRDIVHQQCVEWGEFRMTY
jgi:predicted Holliday junction resolvase-like endonuclease